MKENKFSTKLMVIVLVAILGLTIGLSACTQNDPSTPADTTDSTEVSDAPDPTVEDNARADEVREVTVVFGEHPNQPVVDYAPAQQEIERKTNIRLVFEVVPNSNYNEKKSLLLATNNLPDIIKINQADTVEYASTGVFLPLLSYIDEFVPNYAKKMEEDSNIMKMNIDGELYGFSVLGFNEQVNGYGPVIRMDLLEKNNLPVPTTFEELLTSLIAIKASSPEMVGWTNRDGIKGILRTSSYMLGSGYGIYYDKDIDGGKYVFGQATEQFKNVLDYFSRAYAAEVLDPDYAVNTSQTWQEKLTNGTGAFFIDNSGFGPYHTGTLQTIVPDGELQIIKVPEGLTGIARAQLYAQGWYGNMWAVNSKVEDPEEIMNFFNWCYSDEGRNTTNYGILDDTYVLDDEGLPVWDENFLLEFTDSDSIYNISSEVGTGLLNFCPWAMNSRASRQFEVAKGLFTEMQEEYWNILESDEAYHENMGLLPPLTQEESERVTEITQALNTMLEQEYNSFIMGTKSIDEYDSVISQCKELGSNELEKIYNDANARLAALSE